MPITDAKTEFLSGQVAAEAATGDYRSRIDQHHACNVGGILRLE
jgi:hypothetical protein